MTDNVYNITLDIDKGTPLINYPVTIRKGEGTSNVIRAKLLNHGVVLEMKDTDPISFYCLKPDNHVVLQDPGEIIDIDEGIVEYKINTQVGANAGHIEVAYFKVGDYYTSNNFSIDVKDNVDSNLESSDYIPVLDNLMKIWQDQIEAIQTKLHEVKDWANNEENEIAGILDGYLKELTTSTDKWVSDFESKTSNDFDKLMKDIQTDYDTWKSGITAEIKALTEKVPELDGKLDDILNQIKDLNITDYVKFTDSENWQKLKVTKDDGDFVYDFGKVDSPTIADVMANEDGLRTFYQPAGTDGNNINDSIRGVINTVNGLGNAFGTGNDGGFYARTVTTSGLSDWNELVKKSDMDSKVAELEAKLNATKWSKVFTDITLQNSYGAYGGSGNQWYYFKDEPNEDGEIVRNVRFNLTMTNKNGSKSGDNPAKFPTSVIPTIQIAFTAGGSGSDFYEYVLTTDGTLNIHGTTSNATTNKNPWMIFNNGYTFIIPKTDSRWYDMGQDNAIS